MGRVVLVCRLAARDLRRRPAEAALLLLAIMAATTTLTLGLVLHGVTSKPYQSTREATAGPDVVAGVDPPPDGGQPADLAGLETLARSPGVVGHSGPYPVVWTTLRAHGQRVGVRVEGRDREPASIDQPKLTQGNWVRDGGVVVEAAFADALGVGVGRPISLDGRSFRVVGVAVTAATAPYPEVSCLAFCPGAAGLVWLTQAEARSLPRQGRSLSYVLNLKLADPAAAPAFVDEHNPSRQIAPPGTRASDLEPPVLLAWQDIDEASANLVRNQQKALMTGGWLLGLLAVASVAVLVGGRMADEIRRVGLLKAVGGTPRLVAAVLLAEYLVVALLAAAAGLAVGRLAAPLLIDPSAGLLGRAGVPPLTTPTVGLVTAVAVAVTVLATVVPAVRAARTSTVLALADSARAPRRTPWVIAISARLPVPLLLALRVAARRPRRVVLATVSIAITVSGIVAALAAHADLNADQLSGASALDGSRADRLNQVLLLITITLVALAAVNTILITWATALDVRHSSALARALGATPQQVSTGLSAAQVLPALAGAVLGIPGGIGLFAAVGDSTRIPSLWQLLAVVPATALVVAGLTAVPARTSARRPVAEMLQSELA
ncbi:MAG TPA: FtsX-like permease family protein [Solirubrobacteraceae bacterium]|nr:FtsX-like permease family protein [Solirubrobacteraceae bacterium]